MEETIVKVTGGVQLPRIMFCMTPSAFAFCCMTSSVYAMAQQNMNDKVTVLAAGSLREVMKELGDSFQKETRKGIDASFGPSGKLRSEIEAGCKLDVFASASIEHTDTLAAKKLLSDSAVFAYNDFCVVARPELGMTEPNLVDVLKL